jgi:hypothetical protein
MRLTSRLTASGVERAAALGGEDEGRVRRLPSQLAQRSHLVTAERMRRGLAVLGATHMQRGIAA